ncbi:MAG: hypothetical protein R3210_06945, partial [Roseovarius sp.]|nr:hypothetical protein [Roseovarius sp.]
MPDAMLIVEPGHPLDPGPRALLEQSHALMTTLFTPEENYFLGFEALCAPEVHFLIAREGAEILGTAALVAGHCVLVAVVLLDRVAQAIE